MMYRVSLIILISSLFFAGCKDVDEKVSEPEEPAWEEPQKRQEISYHLISLNDTAGKKTFENYNEAQRFVVAVLNRIDKDRLESLDTLIVPDTFDADFMQYSPFPFGVKDLQKINKIIFFSYPAQAFGVYENGHLVRWGPTNMGREKDQTPTGLFYCNWKAEETISTFNDEWELKWNFNIENKEGVGFHQYHMPGYPASHSCLRLYESDARFLFNWADQWVLENNDNVRIKGTPVVVFGKYPFGQDKPWWGLAEDKEKLDISERQLTNLVKPHMEEILAEQEKRQSEKQQPTE